MYITNCKSISNILLYKDQIIFYRKITIYTNYNSNLTKVRAAVLSSITGFCKFMFEDDKNKHIIILGSLPAFSYQKPNPVKY